MKVNSKTNRFLSKIRKELFIYLVCFATSFCLHIYSYVKVEKKWIEIFSEIQNVAIG